MAGDSEKKKFSTLQAYLVGAAAVLGATATLIASIGSVRDAWCNNIGVFCRLGVSPTATPKDSVSSTDLNPYGVELTALTDPFQAVQDADKAKAIAPVGAEIRLYKRLTREGTIAWAPVVIYTDSSVASNELAKYKGLNDWDPDLITLRTWCPKSRPIPSPIGTPVKIAVFDCT